MPTPCPQSSGNKMSLQQQVSAMLSGLPGQKLEQINLALAEVDKIHRL